MQRPPLRSPNQSLMTMSVHVHRIQTAQRKRPLSTQIPLKSFQSKVLKWAAHQVNHFLLRLSNVSMIHHVSILFNNRLITPIASMPHTVLYFSSQTRADFQWTLLWSILLIIFSSKVGRLQSITQHTLISVRPHFVHIPISSSSTHSIQWLFYSVSTVVSVLSSSGCVQI